MCGSDSAAALHGRVDRGAHGRRGLAGSIRKFAARNDITHCLAPDGDVQCGTRDRDTACGFDLLLLE